MRKYIKPEFSFSQFSVEDIMTQSGMIVHADSLVGENKDMYKIYVQNSSVKSENVSVFSW